jgi:hypothetical protein
MTLKELIADMLPKAEQLRAVLETNGPRVHGGTNHSPRAAAKAVMANLQSLDRMVNGWPAVPEQGVVGSPPTPELAALEV